jgi:vacuolar protein sorting-associated protein 13A/C
LGSSNLIGNPSRFVNNIGTGVTDFFVKPYQGIKDGSIVKMRDGFVVGSRSLIQNSLMAPVGAMAKISNSISKGTLALSFDDKFIASKNYEDRRNKPKTMGDGRRKGFASAKASIHSGITDVFYKPIEGARQQGLRGFIRGGARGAAGLVTKTISGGIDIIAKTSEGLDNQSKS